MTKENSIKRPPFLHGPAELQADVQRGSYIEFPHKNILYLKDVSDTGPRTHTTGTQLREAGIVENWVEKHTRVFTERWRI